MTELGLDVQVPRRWPSLTAWRNRVVSSRAFQSWASRFPLTRGLARREGEALFDLVAGFVQSQVLMALVELRILHRLLERQATAVALAPQLGLNADRLEALLQAGAALGLLSRRRDGSFRTAQRGAALLGVPGLEIMIRHHSVLYRDLADPVAFLKGQTETELAGFWPYVFGAAAAEDPATAATYSHLMADSQALVAEETLRQVSLTGVRRLLDVGGGTGAFLAEAGQAFPALEMELFDLPAVIAGAETRLRTAGVADRVTLTCGSFRDDPLPGGADAISLVRVLYDHSDETVARLLGSVFEALPPGGRLVVSEPMSGGARPERAGDVYFAFYCMAMRTGRVRSQARIAAMLADAGFSGIAQKHSSRPFVTSVVIATRPSG